MAARIALAGIGPNLQGLTWETDRTMRIGRQQNADVVVRDFSVERLHAEIRNHGMRWILRDLADNPIYPTLVNHMPLSGRDHVLKIHDLIQLGKVQFKVIQLMLDTTPESASEAKKEEVGGTTSTGHEIKSSRLHVRVQAATHQTWDQAFEQIALEAVHRLPQDKAMLALVRASHHLTHLLEPQELLQSILSDVVSALRAQRGSIILADPISGQLTLKATVSPTLNVTPGYRPYSDTLAQRCFRLGESILCQDVNADENLVLARSVRHGAMASILCVLLRTPHKRVGILHLDRGFLDDPFTADDLHHADAFAASVAVGIESAQQVERQRDQFIQTVSTLARAADTRDQYPDHHIRRVTDYALLLAEELKLPASERYHIQIGTPLHDIGKIGIDDAILRKPGKLTFGEFEQMKTHTTKGAIMLDSMVHLLPMIPIVKHHHERWDGTGYPDRLAGDQIPLTARIVSVADAFDAMTSQRPYRAAMPTDKAFLELIGQAGTHFDPACVYAFLHARQKVEAIIKA